MRVLVTGGAGYIGDCTVEKLLGAGHDVVVVDKLMYTDSYLRPNVDFYNYDILSDNFGEFIYMNKFDVIIHLAAIVGDGACQANPEVTVETNENAVKELCDHITMYSPNTRLIFTSTCSVYGDNNDVLDEGSETRPLSLYAGTKLNAEKYIRDPITGPDNHVIFRLGTLFGMSSGYGRIRADLVANILTFKACEGQPLTVFGGDQWRPLIHVKDVGRILAEAASSEYTGTYILSHQNYKIVDIANEIIDVSSSETRMTQTDAKFEDLRNYKVDNKKAKGVGISTRISLRKGVAEMQSMFDSGRIKDPWNVLYHNARFVKEMS